MYCGSMVEAINMPFGMVDRMVRWNHVLDGGPGSPRGTGGFGSFGPPVCVGWIFNALVAKKRIRPRDSLQNLVSK